MKQKAANFVAWNAYGAKRQSTNGIRDCTSSETRSYDRFQPPKIRDEHHKSKKQRTFIRTLHTVFEALAALLEIALIYPKISS